MLVSEERPARGLLPCLDLECLEQGCYLCCHDTEIWTVFEVVYFSDACILSCYPNILLIIICSGFTLGVCYDSLFCGAFLDCCLSKCFFGFTDSSLQHIKIFPNPPCYRSLCFVSYCQLLFQQSWRLTCFGNPVLILLGGPKRKVIASRCLWCWNVIIRVLSESNRGAGPPYTWWKLIAWINLQ